MSFSSFREEANFRLYNSKDTVLGILRILSMAVSVSALGIMVYYYGFDHSPESKAFLLGLMEGSFGFYIVRFIIRYLYNFNPLHYFKSNWFETIIMSLLLVEGIAYNIFDTLLLEPIFVSIGFTDFADFSTIFIQLFIFVILIINILTRGSFNTWIKIHPALLFTISILTMTLVGALLLSLPEMSVISGGLNFTDSIFMAMSSVSVTGLTTINVAETLTLKGQVVMLFMIKLGGLNTIAFGALLLVVAKFGVSLKYHEVIEDFVNQDSIGKTNSMLAKIVLWSTSIEVLGIALLYFAFGNQGIFADDSERLFQSVFHGISGFNNAGLSSLNGGMMHPDVIDNYMVHGIVMGLFFLGGLGMIYVIDIFSFGKLRERMATPWKTIEFGTKISLYFTLGLLVFGALVFFILEQNHTLKDTGFTGDLVYSFYESMTTRNAGFNVVDTSAISLPVLIIFLFLMFVGASSGSAGGGIRTSTFAVMCASVIATIQGKKRTELFKRSIPSDTVMKAYSIFIFFAIGNVIGIFALAITEADLLASGRFGFIDLIFEHVSAASTVGLSTGMTSEVSTAGKYVLIMAMFIGRAGTLTIAYLLGKKLISTNYKYPYAGTMVG
ncbi:MAG: hypothetical protein JKY42_01325 [Flavobacteriales bacterium]|nr:hypothetical protein [Flavobacteriales bacterium]